MAFEQIGKYKVIKAIGKGGMATVYLGIDPTFDRQVAIKVLPEQFVQDEEFQKRFLKEAQVIAALEHAAIVPVYDFGQINEQPYLVMRYMPGGSLGDRIMEKGSLEPLEAFRIIDRLCAALDYAHKNRVIHRDLKPENILFGKGDDVFLSDFGIAKLLESTTNLTGDGAIGTPRYMSPEQAYGKHIDHRTDLYSLGVILYEMLTGSQLFQAETPMGLAMAHILEAPPNILDVDPNLSPAIKRVIDTALAKDVNERYQSGHDFSRALGRAVREQADEELSFEDLVVITTPKPAIDDAGTTKISESNMPGDDVRTEKMPSSESADGMPATQMSPVSASAGEATIESAGASVKAAPEATKLKQWLLWAGRIAAIIVATAIVVGLVSTQSRSGFIPFLPGGPTNIVTFNYDTADVELLEVFISLGASEVLIDNTENNANRIEGFNTIVPEINPVEVEYLNDGMSSRLAIEQEVEPIFILGEDPFANVEAYLPTDRVIDLTLMAGLGIADLDLAELNIRNLNIINDSSSSEVRISVPREGNITISLNSEFGAINMLSPAEPIPLNIQEFVIDAGFADTSVTLPVASDYTVDVVAGFGSTVTLVVPEVLEARVLLGETSGQAVPASSLQISSSRLDDQGDGIWETSNYTDADNKVEIVILGAQGTIDITDQ